MNSSSRTFKLAQLMRRAMLLGCAGVSSMAGAANMQALDDSVLSDVQGRDGISFAANLNTKIGSNKFEVPDALGNPSSITHSNVLVTGLYAVKLDISSGGSGEPDFLNWFYPEITSNKPLSMAYDMAINADGLTFGTGVTMQEVLLGGTSVQLSSSNLGGIAFGLAQQLSIANVLLQPNGRGNTVGQMAISGYKIGDASGVGPWVIADLVNQPGQFNILADPAGDRIQVGIDFPKVGDSATGSMQINNITFATPTGPTPTMDLGSSRIGSMQIQHLNIKFKSP